MRIDIDDKSGFCTGVVRAVKKAEEKLGEQDRLFSLGALVHNNAEVKRLEEMGLRSISYEEFNGLASSTVLIRAHGEPPSTYQKAGAANIELIDATCPIVRSLQIRIRKTYESIKGKQGTLLIFGKRNHPEVRSLIGQTEGSAIVVDNPGELSSLRLEPTVFLYAQTTMTTSGFAEFAEALAEFIRTSGMDPERDLTVCNTICRQVSSREPHLRDFASAYDMILFVSGRNSSNGKALFEVCRRVNPKSYFISEPSDIDKIDIEGINSIGICGATSTPAWLMVAVRDRIPERCNNP